MSARRATARRGADVLGRRRLSPRQEAALAVAAVLGALALWWALTAFGLVSRVLLPPPMEVLTAFWQLLRARDGDDLCRLDTVYFDGERRIRLTTSEDSRATDRVVCKGRYIREGGFSRKALKEGRTFPFELSYAPAASGHWQVSRIDAKTLRGRVLLIRR